MDTNATLYADELRGASWDRVRAIRKALFGIDERGVALDDSKVPQVLRPLLGFASLLTTGEEGALLEFWDALGPQEQEALMSAIRPHVAALRDFGLDGEIGSPREPPPTRDAPQVFDFSPERLAGMLEVVKAELDARPPQSRTQQAMLDLARLWDLVSARRRQRERG